MSTKGVDQVRASLRDAPAHVRAALKQAVEKAAIQVVGHVKADKLSGQVLKVKTGRLRRSVSYVVEDKGDSIVAHVGTNLEYAAAHEYGFQGQVNVRAHLRTIKQAWGRPIAPRAIQVQAHSARRHLPERSFLRSSLSDLREQIRADIAAAIEKANK